MTGPKLDDVPAMYQVRPRSFPAGEGWREVSKREFDNYGDFPGYPEGEWERRKLYAVPQPAPAIDLEDISLAAQMLTWGRDEGLDDKQIEEIDAHAAKLFALIDEQANVLSSSEHSDSLTPVARRKLRGLKDDGFIVNGVAIFNPTTGRRGLVDYLGYVGWQTSEQPSKGEGE